MQEKGKKKKYTIVPPTQPLQEQFVMKDSSELVSGLGRYTLEWPSGQILQSSRLYNINGTIFQ